jgi:DNA-directed DNA polymerase III PolC
MIQLRVRTEYSFRKAYGTVEKVVAQFGLDALAITDTGTWGHVPFVKMCKKYNVKPILGAEICVSEEVNLFQAHPSKENMMGFLARNNDGLAEIYELVSKSATQHDRITYEDLFDVSENVIMLSGFKPVWGLLPRTKKENLYIEMSSPKALEFCRAKGFKPVATSDNYYPTSRDKEAYEVLVGTNRVKDAGSIRHDYELPSWMPKDAKENTHYIANECNAELPVAQMISFQSPVSLQELCEVGAEKLGVELTGEYKQRLDRELEAIAEKKFEDYFFVIADMVNYAKNHMLVGPARGSSAGSLVCYLIGITDVDPIKFGLLFERFIDVSRADLPDIDIDFQDDKRELVFEYLRNKYGAEKVAHLGTVSRYKARSAISEVCKDLKMPTADIVLLKDNIIERALGEPRADLCIFDTFTDTRVGRQMMNKYPKLRNAVEMENHARHSGVHAAGVLVTQEPVSRYCSVSQYSAQIDKVDAESLNLLKIDALGLRTLSVIQDVLDQVGWSREKLLSYDLEDQDAFDILNDKKYAGIFQFEGYALKKLTDEMKVRKFDDISAITSLARPGPLNSGGTAQYVKRRIGQTEVTYMHPLLEDITRGTYGVIVYQEQVMLIAKDVGKMSWEDVSLLRKATSKSLGKEYMDRFFESFKAGALTCGVSEAAIQEIWDNINTMGAYAFNKSHAVAYAMVSYYCCVLKSKFPLEFAAATLRNARDDDQTERVLQELKTGGYSYKQFDRYQSEVNWSVQDGQLIGGLTMIRGVGPKMAEDIVRRRKTNQILTPRQEELLSGKKKVAMQSNLF